MDAFVGRLTSEFRSRLWELIARSRPPEVSLDEEAERIYDQLCRRSSGDLAQHVEAYLFLAVADALDAYDRQGQPGARAPSARQPDGEPTQDGPQSAPPRSEITASASARGAIRDHTTAESAEQGEAIGRVPRESMAQRRASERANETADQRQAREALQSQLAALPVGVRSTLLLYRNYQMPLPEIARRLNMTVEDVQSQIKRGLLHCCLSRTKPPARDA